MVAEYTSWKTNMMLPEEQARVEEREQEFTRRTSFEENLVNQHIQKMNDLILETGLQTKGALPNSDRAFEGVRESRHIVEIEENCYWTGEERWGVTGDVLENQENFSIFMRLSSVLLESKQELVYILGSILSYTTQHVEKKAAHQAVSV